MKNLDDKIKIMEKSHLKYRELTNVLDYRGRKLATIVEGIDLGTWEWNIQTGQVEINEKLANIVGYTLDELRPVEINTLIKRVHPDDLKRVSDKLKDYLNGQIEYYDCEVRVRHKYGHWIWVYVRGKVVKKDSSGKPIKMFGTNLDVTTRKEANEKLKESEKRFMLALDKTKAGLWDIDLINKKIFLSSMWKQMLGYEDHEIENSCELLEGLTHPEEKEMIKKAIKDYFRGRTKSYELIHRLKHKDGSWRWILSRGGVLKDENGVNYRWIGTNLDITKSHEQTLEFERVFSVNLDLLFILDMEGNFVKLNKASYDILGYLEDEIKGSKILDFVHREDLKSTTEVMERIRNGEKIDLFINRILHKDGSYRYLEWTANPYENFVYAAARNVTERIYYEKKILEISNRDDLTGVYNRRYIYERAEAMIEEYKREGRIFSVAILDIDDFKSVNDNYGHAIGDKVLKRFTKLIDENLRPYDILGRYGGEEFIVILNNIDQKNASLILKRILKIVQEKTFNLEGNRIKFTFSAGISNCKEVEKEEMIVDKLIRIADRRMYLAKNTGKNKIIYKAFKYKK